VAPNRERNPRPVGYSGTIRCVHVPSREPYRAVSFDLWFTALYFDPEIEAGWKTDRIRALSEILATRDGASCPPAEIERAIDAVQSRFRADGQDPVVIAPKRLVGEYARFLDARITVPPDEAGRRYSSAGLLEHPPPINPELVDVARELVRRGIPAMMVTNTARQESTWKEFLRDRVGLRFEPIVTSCEFGQAKPDPGIFQEASRRLNVPPSGILHVGDRWELDVEGALRSGYGAALYRGLWSRYPDDFYPKIEPPENEYPEVLRIDRLDQLLESLPGPGQHGASGGLRPARRRSSRVKAAVVRELGKPPRFDTFDTPVARTGETIVSVMAAAASPLAVSRVQGRHYSADTALPFVAGVDGVGRTSDGRSVYFSFVRPPFGSMAELAPVATRYTIPLPDGLDPTVAAAAAVPGMSCWVPLTGRARPRAGESVLVNGATGVSGRMAVQVAKHLGVSTVIATGRNEAKLREVGGLGADVVLPLGQPADTLRAAVREAARRSHLGVVLDYLWGPSAETILEALGGPDAPRGASPVRFVQVGTVSGPTITLPGATLRSSGVEILGTGLGSVESPDLMAGIGEFLRALASARFQIDTEVHPLSEVERVWDRALGERRLVFAVA